MPGSFADLHFRGAQPLEYLHRRGDHRGVGIDHRGGVKLHQVGLQQHSFAAHVQAALPNAFEHAADQVVRIRLRADDRHCRISRRPIRQLGRPLELHRAVGSHDGRAAQNDELSAIHARPPALRNR